MELNASSPKYFQYYTYIATLYVVSQLITSVLAYRLIAFGSYMEPGGIIIFPLSYFLGDVIAEVYGYKLARQAIWSAFMCLSLYSIIVSVVIHMPHPADWHNQENFISVLGMSTRAAIATIIGVTSGAFLNAYIISKWKILAHGRYFWFRSLVANATGELIVTCIIASTLFIGILPASHMFAMMVHMYIFKMIYGIIIVFPIWILVRFLKKSEGVDAYDYHTNFNIFKFGMDDSPFISTAKA
jgi:queuosine precursor transporter